MDKVLNDISASLPKHLSVAPIDERRQSFMVRGFTNTRFSAVYAFMAGSPTRRHIRLMLIMGKRYVTVPRLGYNGVKIFWDGKHLANEIRTLDKFKH